MGGWRFFFGVVRMYTIHYTVINNFVLVIIWKIWNVFFFYNCNISIKDLRFEAVSEAVEKSHCYSSGFLKHMNVLVSLFVDL